MVKEMHPQAIKEATASVLPVWLDAFNVLLALDPREDVSSPEKWDGLAIRIQVFRVRHGCFAIANPRSSQSLYRPSIPSTLPSLEHCEPI
jgi:hypothetical protein